MKKFLIGLFSMMCVVAALVIAAVITLNNIYYENVFPMGVWINGVYCTGMTAEEVSSLLENSYDVHEEQIEIRTIDGSIHKLALDEYGVSVTYTSEVKSCLEKRENHYRWLKEIAFPRKYNLLPAYVYDTDAMKAKLEELDWMNERCYNPQNTVSIVKSAAAGYILIDETKDLLLKEDAVELICDEIVNQLTYSDGQFEMIDLSSEENQKICYKSIPYTEKMKDTLSKWEGVNAFQSFRMTYLFGDRAEIIDENVVADWMALDDDGNIIFDENNNPVLDETVMEEYVAYLSATYNTVGIEREFKATDGDIVKISGGSYGNEIDEKAEYSFLLNAFLNKESGTRVPQYISEAKEKGSDDIGDTYIEIDMGSQHMYYYIDGELVMDTPVVTGNSSRGWDTPAKVCFVYFKQRNRVLRGANYATPVKYWMAVDGHIGIHDATWRKEFGGEIYKTNGSHGCINTPLDIMSELYELAEVGTPVIMFY
ncbi:MAG: L,D-transpeptidase family protein [Lachnospiraceae bacterium]|nr:L,D-transpeptidase family protein [Lachnospiraceae bacterium]